MLDYLMGENPDLPLEYLCYAFCLSYRYREEEFWDATTDMVFTWLEFSHVEAITKKTVRFVHV